MFDETLSERKMGKNYYCDYCNKSFKDILATRKKHLKGLQHQKAYKEYHAQFKGIKEIYLEESRKKTCKRILEGTTCKFGSECRFSHYTKDQLEGMRLQIEAETARKHPEVQNPDPQWLEKFVERVWDRAVRDGCSVKPFWTHPYHQRQYEALPDLPPSLQPLNPSLLEGNSDDTSYS
ncbi:zinc finger matrin-type protein 5 [Lutzomyia longipalpis]|uniref:zinc finger matrin-type protein 5 n=1 Tax=Lutzomyia longipalpis TaxID=7200 RepID=UPI002483F1BC|nr:zinc finger matrin-type protein 5 [Lutzomyia longipalpis]